MSSNPPGSSIKSDVPAPAKLERVKGLSPREFMERFVIPGKPAILQDATVQWAALQKWEPAFWKEHYGQREATIDGKQYTMNEVIDLALQSNAERPAPYYRNIRLSEEYPELMPDISPYPGMCGPNWFHSAAFYPLRNKVVGGGGHYELFIGGAGRSFPFLHYDAPGAHTFIHQIIGHKKFILFAPEDGRYLYPAEGKSFSVSRIKDLENTNAPEFPLYRNAIRYEDQAGPGETLFMPSGWWHTAKMLSFSISLGIDVANKTNWPQVTGYMSKRTSFENPLLSIPYMAMIRTAGLAAWIGGIF